MSSPTQEALFDVDLPKITDIGPGFAFLAAPDWVWAYGDIGEAGRILLMAIVTLYGDPEDGNRLRVTAEPLSQEDLALRLRMTVHKLKAATDRLCDPHNCPRCRSRHAIIRVDRLSCSTAYRYRIVKCDDVELLLPMELPTKRPVVPPHQAMRMRAIVTEADGSQRDEALGEDGAADDDNEPRTTVFVAEPTVSPKVGILREIERYHNRVSGRVTIGVPVLEAIADRCFDGEAIAQRLEVALDLVRSRAAKERRHVVPTFAAAVLEESRNAVHDIFAIALDRSDPHYWELGRIMELMLRNGERPAVETARTFLTTITKLIAAYVGDDLRAIERECQRILTDPRVFGTPTREVKHRNAFGFIIAGLKPPGPGTGYLRSEAATDDGHGRLLTAFERAVPRDEDRQAIFAMIRAHVADNATLDHALLARHQITGVAMIGFLIEQCKNALSLSLARKTT